MEFKFILKILIMILLVFSLIVFINSLGLNLNEPEPKKKLLGVVTVEGLENPLASSGAQAFCNSHHGFDLEKSCNKLTKNNCNSTSCCTWTDKCVSTDKYGPVF